MNTARTVISVVIVMIGLFANINSDVIDEWLDEQMTFEEVLSSNGKSDLIKIALNKKNDF